MPTQLGLSAFLGAVTRPSTAGKLTRKAMNLGRGRGGGRVYVSDHNTKSEIHSEFTSMYAGSQPAPGFRVRRTSGVSQKLPRHSTSIKVGQTGCFVFEMRNRWHCREPSFSLLSSASASYGQPALNHHKPVNRATTNSIHARACYKPRTLRLRRHFLSEIWQNWSLRTVARTRLQPSQRAVFSLRLSLDNWAAGQQGACRSEQEDPKASGDAPARLLWHLRPAWFGALG